MTRLAPAFPPDITTLASRRDPLFDLDISVVTPLFGGGPVAREVDATRPVSGKSVRGQLRFWWRACRGAKFQTVQELFEAEELIWGSTDTPSAVDVRVEVTNDGTYVPAFVKEPTRRGGERQVPTDGFPGYALFPFQEQKEDRRKGTPYVPIANGRAGVKFRLTILLAQHATLHSVKRWDKKTAKYKVIEVDVEAEVKAALWAWLLFGGIGARTRRGCGSLFCQEPGFHYDSKTFMDATRKHITHGKCSLPIPILSDARIVATEPKPFQEWCENVNKERSRSRPPLSAIPMAFQAWSEAVAVYQQIRQGEGVGRNKASDPRRQSKLGRSFWPEPDNIRVLSDTYSPRHKPENAIDYYPRADLGLPIIFHFDEESRRDGDPQDAELNVSGDKASRMASPIITKCLALSETEAVSTVLLLNAPHVWEQKTLSVSISYKNAQGRSEAKELSTEELCNPTKSRDVKPMQGYGDTARDAFVAFAIKEWETKAITL